MKKALTILFLSLSVMIILDSVNAGHAIVMFFLAGVIPGTNIAISANSMLIICTLLIGFTLSRVTINLARNAAERRANQQTTPRRATRVSSAHA